MEEDPERILLFPFFETRSLRVALAVLNSM